MSNESDILWIGEDRGFPEESSYFGWATKQFEEGTVKYIKHSVHDSMKEELCKERDLATKGMNVLNASLKSANEKIAELENSLEYMKERLNEESNKSHIADKQLSELRLANPNAGPTDSLHEKYRLREEIAGLKAEIGELESIVNSEFNFAKEAVRFKNEAVRLKIVLKEIYDLAMSGTHVDSAHLLDKVLGIASKSLF